ncbi:MAG: hypothetical protein KIT14_07915 [bacterium]|nr:hypothetical protein [bacterium]
MRTPGVLARVAELLTDAWGGPVRARDADLLKSWSRTDVLRLRLDAPAGRPPTVIVKRSKHAERGADEHAALTLVSEAGRAAGTVPRVLAADPALRLLVLEDLGAGPTVEQLLRGHDGEEAADAVIGTARAVGRLHAATADLGAEYDRRRDRLGPRTPPLVQAVRDLHDDRAALAAWLGALDVHEPAHVERTLTEMGARLAAPAAFGVLTHGDVAPANAVRGSAGVLLVDFEYAGVRHALTDTLCWTLACPFPLELAMRADAAYRAEARAALPMLDDDAAAGAARILVVGARVLDLLRWLPPALLLRDRGWAPGMSGRQAVLWHLERALAIAERDGAGGLEPLVPTLRLLSVRLSARWTAERDTLFTWPALRAGTAARRRAVP